MSTLTTILRRAGYIEDADVTRVEAHSRAHRCAPFVSVVELGLADENDLLRLLSARLMIPIASAEVLTRVEPETLASVPAELAWSGGVLPVSLDDTGNLTLAMADPTDERAVNAVADHTGAYLLRAVAPVGALRDAVRHYYGEPTTPSKGPPTPLQIPAVRDEPDDEPEAPAADVVPLSTAAFAAVLPRLVGAADRDTIMEVLLDFLGEGFERVILFIHLRDELKGRDARGTDMVREAVTQVRIPTKGPSVFSDVIQSAQVSFGPWPTERAIDRAFDRAMGGIRGNVLVLPVRVRDKVPVLVFASGAQNPVDPRSLDQLVSSVQSALERLIFRKKSRSGH
ncbi:MAG: hypothetical protein ACE37F_25705 [Nannocystaceae bacterium]|nr:hypothetical protein [bacterium]